VTNGVRRDARPATGQSIPVVCVVFKGFDIYLDFFCLVFLSSRGPG